ncbi:MAG: hypothetical protein BGO14_01280 [Chlamydiales bacterium 38-26]|nr:hypothetical protein [Chlamydiales bacterium]OJV08084.1 MAG: hypothetical protein BGO14_01280 [Chlamydiales bacterium 38-26]
MNTTNASVFNICFKSSSKTFHAFSYGHKQINYSCIFVILLNKEKYKNIDIQEITRRPDHFSWHVNGKGHLKINADHKMQKGQFADGTFLPSSPSDLSPLFIISHIQGEGTWEAKHIESLPPLSYILDIGHLEKFSILGFLIPCNMPITAFQHLNACFTPENKIPLEIPLSDLFFLPACYIRLSVYPSFDILILISDLINLDMKSLEQLKRQFERGA